MNATCDIGRAENSSICNPSVIRDVYTHGRLSRSSTLISTVVPLTVAAAATPVRHVLATLRIPAPGPRAGSWTANVVTDAHATVIAASMTTARTSASE